MSEATNELNTINNIAIDKKYLIDTLHSFDDNILEKKYSFKVDGTNILVPAPEYNDGIIFQYIGDGTDNKGLQYGYFYKIVYKEEDQLDTYVATDSEGETYTVYLNGNHLWTTTDNATYSPINGAKFNLTNDYSKLTYNGLDYTKEEDSVTGVLSGYLAISTQPDAAEPITYNIKQEDDENNPDYIFQLYKTELGVESIVENSTIRIPKARIIEDTRLLTGVHEGDPEKVNTEETGKYYATNYGVDPLPGFNNTDFSKGDDTYIMLVFDTSGYSDNEGSDISDKSYVYIPTTSLLDETDLGYGLEVDGGKFKVTTQVDTLPGSDKTEGEERQSYLSIYADNENNPKVIQLTTDGLFYELQNKDGTYSWEYIAPVKFEGENITFTTEDFQIGTDEIGA